MEIKKIVFVILAVPISIIFGRSINIQPPERLANPGEFPHMVQLSSTRTGEIFCGGAIIHPSIILTPAVCLDFIFKRPVDTILATAGKISLKGESNRTEEGEQTRTVAHFEVHPNYVFLLFKDNLALVFLTESFNLTEKVQPIQLPSSNQSYSSGTVAGWNFQTWGNLSVTQLSKFTLELDEREDCNRESYLEPRRFKVTDTELCGKLKKESGICKVPMGSSLICEEKAVLVSGEIETGDTSGPVVCGMATWGKGFAACGEKDLNREPISVFQDVAKYVDWIQGRIEENLKNCTGELFDCGIGQEIRCIPVEKKCNGVNDCHNGSDEELCGTNVPDFPSDTPDVTPEGHVKVEVKERQKTGKWTEATEKSILYLFVAVGMIIMLGNVYYIIMERIENMPDN